MNKLITTFLLLALPLLVSAYDAEINGIYYNLKGNTAEVTYEKKSSIYPYYISSYKNVVNIPESINYEGADYTVTCIGDFAFYCCSGLTSVIIPNSVTIIGKYAFQSCSNLTSVDIPNSVTSIDNYAFRYCSSLNSIDIPNSVAWIGEYAFADCKCLTSVNLPNSLTEIVWYSFSNCISLKSVIIPNSVTSIGYYAFLNCYELTSVTIPNSVTNIVEGAFCGCTKITSATIPNSVTKIERRAFDNCSDLTSIISKMENPCNITSDCFTNEVFTNSTLYIPKGTLEKYKSTKYWNKFIHIEEGNPFEHTLTYIVDGDTYSSYTMEEGDEITPEEAPVKEGYTFSGWNEIPSIMPANDVTITGSFTKNKYKLTYMVDGKEYKSSEVEFESTITAEENPTKEGYTFSGWSEIPETMPASDVTITGTFTINKYKLTYTLDGEEYKSTEVDYGTSLTPEEAPVKEGYTFSGWSEIPETMPASDVTISGTFTPNKYKLTYTVDGEEYKASEVDYGTAITAEAVPTKEGYTFSGWSEIPSTMPAEDVTVTGSFTVNKYTITYMVDDAVLMTEEVAYGSAIAPPKSQKDGYEILWSSHPTTMPAYDITIYGTYTTGINALTNEEDDRQVFTPDGKRVETPKKGLNIIRMNDGTVKKVVVK